MFLVPEKKLNLVSAEIKSYKLCFLHLQNQERSGKRAAVASQPNAKKKVVGSNPAFSFSFPYWHNSTLSFCITFFSTYDIKVQK